MHYSFYLWHLVHYIISFDWCFICGIKFVSSKGCFEFARGVFFPRGFIGFFVQRPMRSVCSVCVCVTSKRWQIDAKMWFLWVDVQNFLFGFFLYFPVSKVHFSMGFYWNQCQQFQEPSIILWLVHYEGFKTKHSHLFCILRLFTGFLSVFI